MWRSKNSVVGRVNPAVSDIYRKSPRYVKEKFVNFSSLSHYLLGESHWHIPVMKHLISSEFSVGCLGRLWPIKI